MSQGPVSLVWLTQVLLALVLLALVLLALVLLTLVWLTLVWLTCGSPWRESSARVAGRCRP